MGLVRIHDVSLSFGGPRLLDCATIQIESGERIGLLGRNGSGKSTFMKLIAGEVHPDSGEVVYGGDVRVALLPQDVPDDLPGTVYDVVASGGFEHARLLSKYHDLTMASPAVRTTGSKDARTGAAASHPVIERTALDENALDTFGGHEAAVLLQKPVADPDLLLLDEPTNHLDVAIPGSRNSS